MTTEEAAAAIAQAMARKHVMTVDTWDVLAGQFALPSLEPEPLVFLLIESDEAAGVGVLLLTEESAVELAKTLVDSIAIARAKRIRSTN